jgi:aspartate kinase
LRDALSRRFPAAIRVVDTLGAVSAVGAGINASFAALRAGSRAFEGQGIVPASIATSSFRVTWLIDRARLDEAVKWLHAALLLPPA